ncbi:hypothetical protein [Treponema sp. UBA3813]|uniref:hypothetical protein n=1 Tax=Treponema sp. UBA3813 TaxID=1947715 RepID=UPI0025F9CE9D|nr:hypothetical protein [Treponema sp. UBA3813]
MKKINGILAGAFAALAISLLAGCGSTKVSNNVSSTPEESVVVDWQGRTLGGPVAPTWLAQWTNNDFAAVKKSLNLKESDVVKIVQMNAATQAVAQSLARTDVAAQLASGLQQTVLTEAGSGINDEGQREAVDRAARAAKAKISGFTEVAGFWQKTRATAANGEQTVEYIQWVAFSSTKENWERICKIYLGEIAGANGLTTDTQKKI